MVTSSALSVCSITLLHLPQDPSTLSLYLVLISCLWKVLCVIGNIRTSRGAVLHLEIGQCSWWRHQGIRNFKWHGHEKKSCFHMKALGYLIKKWGVFLKYSRCQTPREKWKRPGKACMRALFGAPNGAALNYLHLHSLPVSFFLIFLDILLQENFIRPHFVMSRPSASS